MLNPSTSECIKLKQSPSTLSTVLEITHTSTNKQSITTTIQTVHTWWGHSRRWTHSLRGRRTIHRPGRRHPRRQHSGRGTTRRILSRRRHTWCVLELNQLRYTQGAPPPLLGGRYPGKFIPQHANQDTNAVPTFIPGPNRELMRQINTY